METIVIVAGETAEDQRSLYSWLIAEDELRGRVRLEHSSVPGTLGSLPGELIAVLAPGVSTALAGSVVAWLRHRTADVRCVFTRQDGTRVEVSARRLQHADLAGLRAIVDELDGELTAPDDPADGAGRATLSNGH